MDPQHEKLEEVYDGHFDYVWNSLRRLDVPERDLEDVCHEVFLVAFRNFDAYDRDRPIRPWLFGIAFRVASDYREKASHAREKLTDPDPPAQAPEVVEKLTAEEARELVMEALQHVDLERRAVFVLHQLDGHAIPEVAESLSIPVDTAYSRLRKARKEFEGAVRSIAREEEARE